MAIRWRWLVVVVMGMISVNRSHCTGEAPDGLGGPTREPPVNDDRQAAETAAAAAGTEAGRRMDVMFPHGIFPDVV